MEVLRPGKNPTEELFYGTCGHCGAQLRAKRSELDVQNDFREGGQFGRAKCAMEFCPHEVIFYPEKSRAATSQAYRD